jgi:hypothetical protein
MFTTFVGIFLYLEQICDCAVIGHNKNEREETWLIMTSNKSLMLYFYQKMPSAIFLNLSEKNSSSKQLLNLSEVKVLLHLH